MHPVGGERARREECRRSVQRRVSVKDVLHFVKQRNLEFDATHPQVRPKHPPKNTAIPRLGNCAHSQAC